MTVTRTAFTLRPERAEDAAFRFDLFRASLPPAARLDGLDPTLATQLFRHQFAGQEASYRAAHPVARHEIVEVAGVPVGRLVIDESAPSWTLVDIALMPDARGGGLGTAILRAFREAADGKGCAVLLTVAAGNPARRLYERAGFVATRVTDAGVAMERPAAARVRRSEP